MRRSTPHDFRHHHRHCPKHAQGKSGTGKGKVGAGKVRGKGKSGGKGKSHGAGKGKGEAYRPGLAKVLVLFP